MNIRSLSFMMLTMLSTLFFVPLANAASSNPGKVTYLHTFGSAFSFSLMGITTGCPGGGNQFFVEWATPNSKQMYGLILAAYAAGDLIAVVSYSCNSPSVSGAASAIDVDSRKP